MKVALFRLKAMTIAEECRRNAEEAEQAAEQCQDVEARRLFRQVAREWRDIADLRERNGW